MVIYHYIYIFDLICYHEPGIINRSFMFFVIQFALTLIFVETKRGADALERWLSMNGFPAISIHGDKVQMVGLFSPVYNVLYISNICICSLMAMLHKFGAAFLFIL